MPSITNVGGSLTSALILTLLAWGVRWVRSQALQQRKGADGGSEEPRSIGRFFSRISPAALCMLVDTNPIAHLLVDVRPRSSGSGGAGGDNDGGDGKEEEEQPLPPELQKALRLDAAELDQALSSPSAWREALPEDQAFGAQQQQQHTQLAQQQQQQYRHHSAAAAAPMQQQQLPHPDTTLVLLADTEEEAREAAAAAAARGYQRTAVLQGGLAGWRTAAASGRLAAGGDLQYIERDALALLLGVVGVGGLPCGGSSGNGDLQQAMMQAGGAVAAGGGVRRAGGYFNGSGAGGGAGGGGAGLRVIDLRRADERTLYGSLPGAVHLPVDRFASALALPAGAFREAYRFERPGPDDPVVLYCRTNRRASWAALMATDAGLRGCLVYKQGVYGWRFSPGVRAYRHYGPTDAPPEPEDQWSGGGGDDGLGAQQVDVAAGLEQLRELGLLGLLQQQQAAAAQAS